MATDSLVNSQILDSVKENAASVIGSATIQTQSMLDALMAETMGMAMYNAVTTQHNSQMLASAAVTAACARMLKVQSAAPPIFRLVSPVVAGVIPTPVPAGATAVPVQITGSGFQPNLQVDVYTSAGTLAGIAAGSPQISDVTPASFTMTASLFPVAGQYGLEVVNPDGGRSSRFLVTAELPPPTVATVAPSGAANTYTVTGTGFETGMTVAVSNEQGAALPAPLLTGVSATSFTMAISPGSATGPFTMVITNPDGQKCTRNFSAA